MILVNSVLRAQLVVLQCILNFLQVDKLSYPPNWPTTDLSSRRALTGFGKMKRLISFTLRMLWKRKQCREHKQCRLCLFTVDVIQVIAMTSQFLEDVMTAHVLAELFRLHI